MCAVTVAFHYLHYQITREGNLELEMLKKLVFADSQGLQRKQKMQDNVDSLNTVYKNDEMNQHRKEKGLHQAHCTSTSVACIKIKI